MTGTLKINSSSKTRALLSSHNNSAEFCLCWIKITNKQTNPFYGFYTRTAQVIHWLNQPVKPGFHYPSWRPELTARVDGWRVSTSRVDGGPSTRLVETRARQHGPCWWVMETGHPSTRVVETGLHSLSQQLVWFAFNNLLHLSQTTASLLFKYRKASWTNSFHVIFGLPLAYNPFHQSINLVRS